MIRVLLVHDASLLRSALARLVNGEHDIDVVTTPWQGALHRARSLCTDVCVVDVDCPGASPDTASGLAELARHTASRGSSLLVLADPAKPGLLRRAFEARALGFVSKDASPHRLLAAIRQVASGERYVDESLALGLLEAVEMPLTPRELSVLAMAAEGASISEIAGSLHLSSGTVRNYMSAIKRKTGARNRIDAIRISQSAGWV